MTKARLALILILPFCLSVLISSAQTPRVAEQHPKPGASPDCSVGETNAPVSVEVFNDYQCPVCETFNQELKRLEVTYRGKVRITFRNYPLTTIHQNAFAAAQAAEAAGLQGRFVDMIDLLYDQQTQWAESHNAERLFVSYAQKLKLDVKKFTADMNSEEVRNRISLDIERARSLNVIGTPTVLINGKMLKSRTDADQAIKDALNSAS